MADLHELENRELKRQMADLRKISRQLERDAKSARAERDSAVREVTKAKGAFDLLTEEHVKLRAECDLLRRIRWGVAANAGRRAGSRAPRWVHVKHATGLGSTSSCELCLAEGFDPHEDVGLDPVVADIPFELEPDEQTP